MTLFWILGAVIAVLAMAVALRPLWRRAGGAVARRELNISVYRDQLREIEADLAAGTLAQADYDASRRELERRLLDDVATPEVETKAGRPGRALFASAALALPLFALAVYLAVGTPAALGPIPVAPEAEGAPQVGMAQIEGMVAKLADRLEKNPDDVEGWKMLGRSYMVIGRFGESAKAYAEAAKRAPRDAGVLTDLADALAMARERRMAGEPEELVKRALQIDPKNAKALALAGSAAFERGDHAGAARLWERMLPLVDAGSEDEKAIRESIGEAKRLAAEQPAPKKGAKK